MKLEAKLGYELSPNYGLWLGTEDVFGDGGCWQDCISDAKSLPAISSEIMNLVLNTTKA